jgi:tetratricopeptide (TPR) repeat protein
MARSFFAFTVLLVTAIFLLPAAAATPAPAAPVPAQPAAAAQPGTAATPGPVAASKRVTYPEVAEAAQILVNTGSLQATLKKLVEATRKYPELPSPHVLMYQFLKDAQPNAARLQLEEAINVDPSDPEPYILLAEIAIPERRMIEAALALERAKQLLATYKTAEDRKNLQFLMFSDLAQLAESRENWKEAELNLRELLKLLPENLVRNRLTAHQRLARSLFLQGKTTDAYEVLRKAKELDAANAKNYNTREVFLAPEAILGKFYDEFEGPKSNNSMKCFEYALKNSPMDLTTRQFIATWALENGKLDFAKEQAKAILKIEETDLAKYRNSKTGHMLSGLVALSEKKWQDAENNFDWILRLDPNDFRARNNMALALVEQQDRAKRERAGELAFANYRDFTNNRSLDVISTLAWVSVRRDKFDDAEAALKRYVELVGGLRDADTATCYAYVLNHKDQQANAKGVLEKILKAERPFSLQKEAQELYEKLKDVKSPESSAPAKPK